MASPVRPKGQGSVCSNISLIPRCARITGQFLRCRRSCRQPIQVHMRLLNSQLVGRPHHHRQQMKKCGRRWGEFSLNWRCSMQLTGRVEHNTSGRERASSAALDRTSRGQHVQREIPASTLSLRWRNTLTRRVRLALPVAEEQAPARLTG